MALDIVTNEIGLYHFLETRKVLILKNGSITFMTFKSSSVESDW